MAPAVLPDSEDEEEDLTSTSNDLAAGSTQSADSQSINNQSTGSTERLKREIAKAEQSLASRSAIDTATRTTISMAKYATQTPGIKRRHSEVPTEPLTVTSRLKRIKSAIDTSSLSSGLLSQDILRGNDFSEHSQQPQPSSIGFVPQGSIKEGFLAHEPYAMFGQSGDTEPYNTATQQLARDLATEIQHTTQEPESLRDFADGIRASKSSSALPDSSQLFQPSMSLSQAPANHTALQLLAGSQDENPVTSIVLEATHEEQLKMIMEAAADVVQEVDPSEGSSATIHVAQSRSAEGKAGSVAMHNDQASEAPMSSQTALIGLPAEKYVPRPSRRRATKGPELPDNFVANPEKITRSKRTKTNKAKAMSKDADKQLKDDDGSVSVDSVVVDRSDLAKTGERDSADGAQGIIQLPEQEQAPSESTKDELALSQADEINLVPKQSSNKPELAFAKLASKKSKKANGRIKRSQTTIFEDHVNLDVKEHVPNLSTQQATRKEALKDLENDQDNTKSQKSKSKLVDDDRDELSLDFGSSRKEDLVRLAIKTSKKSGSPSKLPEIAASSSPSKMSKLDKVAPVVVEDEKEGTEEVSDRPDSTQDLQRALTPDATPPLKITPRHQTYAPRTDAKAAPKHPMVIDPKSSPTHSPIKVGQGPSMRVGLSKRHRIPSLLKMVRPGKK